MIKGIWIKKKDVVWKYIEVKDITLASKFNDFEPKRPARNSQNMWRTESTTG